MRRTTRLVRTPARPDSSADPTGLRPKPRGSRSARAILHTGWLRAGRVLANWKLSGDYRLVWEAVSHRCQEPLREFLEAHKEAMPISGRLALESGIRDYESKLSWTKYAIAMYARKNKGGTSS